MEVPDVIQHNVVQELRSLILTPAEIEVILKSLPIGKVAGPDGISNRIIRELATELLYPLFLINLYKLKISLILGNYQMCVLSLKEAIVHLYPIFALCLFYARLKKSMNKRFSNRFNHFRENIILTLLQSGSIPGDSTVNQLTYLYNVLSQAIDFGNEVRVVFCDLSKVLIVFGMKVS